MGVYSVPLDLIHLTLITEVGYRISEDLISYRMDTLNSDPDYTINGYIRSDGLVSVADFQSWAHAAKRLGWSDIKIWFGAGDSEVWESANGNL